MADSESHIRDLRKRLDREPGSRYFVPLADEYRKAGRLAEAIETLEGGLTVHPGYVAARIALARAYLEAGRIEESVGAFTAALADDPSNLVAAKALGDIHLSRGESLEALKRYLRYRAISGDRRLDALILRLEDETAASRHAPGAAPASPTPPPPPPSFRPTPLPGAAFPAAPPARLVDPMAIPAAGAPVRHTDPHDISGVTYEPPSEPFSTEEEVWDVPSRDVSLDSIASPRRDDEEIVTRKIRLPEAIWPFEPAAAPPAIQDVQPTGVETTVAPGHAGAPEPPSPPGRTLADLYFEQAHYPEAVGAYEELLSADPGNEELRRLRDHALRLAGPIATAGLPPADPGNERRLEKIRLLNEWLAVIQTSAGGRESGTENRIDPSS